MSRFFITRPWLLFIFVLALVYGCGSHQGVDHPGVGQVVKGLTARLAAGDRVLFLGLSGADGQKDRLAARVYAYINPMLDRGCGKRKAVLVKPERFEPLRRLWRFDLAGVGRNDPGAAFLLGVRVVVRGTVVAEGDEVRVFLRADDIKNGKVLFDNTAGFIDLRRLPERAGIQENYDSEPDRAGSEDGRLELWSGSPVYDQGGDMHFFFKVKKKSYVTIFEINSAGRKRLLYPNTFQPRLLCRPGFAYQVPAAEVPFSLSATGPGGTSRIVAVMTGRPGIEEIGMEENGPAFTDILIQGTMSQAAIRVGIR